MPLLAFSQGKFIVTPMQLLFSSKMKERLSFEVVAVGGQLPAACVHKKMKMCGAIGGKRGRAASGRQSRVLVEPKRSGRVMSESNRNGVHHTQNFFLLDNIY